MKVSKVYLLIILAVVVVSAIVLLLVSNPELATNQSAKLPQYTAQTENYNNSLIIEEKKVSDFLDDFGYTDLDTITTNDGAVDGIPTTNISEIKFVLTDVEQSGQRRYETDDRVNVLKSIGYQYNEDNQVLSINLHFSKEYFNRLSSEEKDSEASFLALEGLYNLQYGKYKSQIEVNRPDRIDFYGMGNNYVVSKYEELGNIIRIEQL